MAFDSRSKSENLIRPNEANPTRNLEKREVEYVSSTNESQVIHHN
jgi:hypothetical protein